jgi:predicted nuclease with TOPRIM domain
MTVIGLAVALLALAAGCESSQRDPSLAEQIERLEQERAQLVARLEKSEAQKEQMKGQIKNLARVSDQLKDENVHRLERIKITRYTNLYDKDEDGQYEKLIVYIQPIDRDGDVIKAPGAANVELWDPSKEPEQALLGRWQVQAKQMKKRWLKALLGTNYRLIFDLDAKIAEYKEPLMVRVVFSDHQSGRELTELKVIKARQ